MFDNLEESGAQAAKLDPEAARSQASQIDDSARTDASEVDTEGSEAEAEGTGIWRLVGEALGGSDRDFARLRLRRAIPLLAIPMVLEMAMEAIFAITDIYFVSRIGPDAIATVGLTESLITLVYALAIGLSMPVTAMVARRYGEGDREAAARAGAQAIWVGVGFGLLIGVPAPFFAEELLRLMGAEPAVVASGSGFTAVLMGTNVVIMLLFIQNAIFRGAGDATHAMRALWLANGVNLILDPCLIFGWGPFPEMGVTGAAVATSIGRGLGVLYQLHHLRRGPRIVLAGAAMRPDFALMRQLLQRSVGGVSQYLVSTASWVALVRILAGFGSVAVAGYTVAMRIVIFALLPSWGFANATSTLVGQSLGAGDPNRARRAVMLSGLYNMGFLGVVGLIFVGAPEAVAALLTDDPAVLAVASRALWIVALGFIFYAWEMVLIQSFNGAGDTKTPTWINLACFWAFEIPIAWWLSNGEWGAGWGPDGVFASVALAYSAAAIVAYFAFRRGRWADVKI